MVRCTPSTQIKILRQHPIPRWQKEKRFQGDNGCCCFREICGGLSGSLQGGEWHSATGAPFDRAQMKFLGLYTMKLVEIGVVIPVTNDECHKNV